jgi:hypothetical protein
MAEMLLLELAMMVHFLQLVVKLVDLNLLSKTTSLYLNQKEKHW